MLNFKYWLEQQIDPLTQVKKSAQMAIAANQDAEGAVKKSIAQELNKQKVDPKTVAKLVKVAGTLKKEADPTQIGPAPR